MANTWKYALFVALVAWYLHEPVPRGFSQPWKLRAITAVEKVVLNSLKVLDFVGIWPLHQSIDTMMKYYIQDCEVPTGYQVNMYVLDGVEVRIYRPLEAPEQGGYPGFVFYHGGGFFAGNTRMYDKLMFGLTERFHMVIVSVEYSKSPQAQYPIPGNECLTATKYFLSNAAKFGVDPTRVAISGDSAGGNIAATIALQLRDTKFSPMPKLQVLIYPGLQAFDFSLPSYQQNTHRPMQSPYLCSYAWSIYLNGSSKYQWHILRNLHTSQEAKRQIYKSSIRHEDLQIDYHYKPYKKPSLNVGNEAIWSEIADKVLDPYVSPLLASDVSGLPRTLMYTAHYDMLRDEAMLYVQKLRKSGVEVEHIHATKQFHGNCAHEDIFPKEAKDCYNYITNYLKENL